MKLFTLKDFILYNTPCFSCGSKISVHLDVLNNKTGIFSQIKPIVDGKFITFKLIIGYSNNLYIILDTVSNTFGSNNFKHLSSYLQDKSLWINTCCRKCTTNTQSNCLNININKKFIKPLTIKSEQVHIKTKQDSYIVNSDLDNDTGVIFVIRDKNQVLELKVRALPMYKFKNKEALLLKIKNYILFS